MKIEPFKFTGVQHLDTKLLIALKELQELRNESATARMVTLRDSILDMCSHPDDELDIEVARFTIHPGRQKCNFTRLRREVGKRAENYISTSPNSVWIQEIDVNLINEELERRDKWGQQAI